MKTLPLLLAAIVSFANPASALKHSEATILFKTNWCADKVVAARLHDLEVLARTPNNKLAVKNLIDAINAYSILGECEPLEKGTVVNFLNPQSIVKGMVCVKLKYVPKCRWIGEDELAK